MKRIYLLFSLALCIPSVLPAQNPMFVPFGQPRIEVQQFLSTRDYARTQDTTAAHRLTQAVSSRQKVHYFFKEDVLYAIEDERFYDNRDIAERVIKSCLEYLSQGKKKLRTVSNQGGIHRYAAVEDDRLIELMVQHEGRGKKRVSRVYLKATSRWHGPRMKTENLVAEIVNQ